jgi:hypothetical protein
MEEKVLARSSTATSTDEYENTESVNRLTVFTFLWACQAMVHQNFFAQWLYDGNPLGWILTATIAATVLFPGSLLLFSLFLSSSIVYNIGNWPFVANHILLESLINLTILIAIAWTVTDSRKENLAARELQEKIFDRFAPVVGVMVILMYGFILISKLNWDFLDIDTSCVNGFYQDVTDRFYFLPLPESHSVFTAVLWMFLGIEILIPLLLCFQKTRYIGLIIAIPFHFLLGLIGHRTFSVFIFALYGLFAAGSLVVLINSFKQRIDITHLKKGIFYLRLLFTGYALIMTIALWQGQFTAPGTGLLGAMDYGPEIWLVGSVFFAAILYLAVIRSYVDGDSEALNFRSARPAYLWSILSLVILNALSPYLGLKTETSFAMYSNLKTEGEANNHIFMPALRLAAFQDDLVEIVETDHPGLLGLMAPVPLADRSQTKRKQLLTYFEFHRLISESSRVFQVTYLRNNELLHYDCCATGAEDSGLSSKQSLILRKLLRFRPVHQDALSYCQH